MIPNKPIGVLDSGVGGLTVLTALRKRFPHEDFLYYADTAHVPYGGREPEEIRKFAIDISEYLVSRNCKAIVMACHISSAVAAPAVRAAHPEIHVQDLLPPAFIEDVKKNAPSGKIGVIATAATVKTGSIVQALKSVDGGRASASGAPSADGPAAGLTVTQIGCPKFVPLIEAGKVEGADVEAAVAEYCEPLARAGVEAVVYGCTHYPLLEKAVAAFFQSRGQSPKLMNPAVAVAESLWQTMKSKRHVNIRLGDGIPKFVASGDQEHLRAALKQFNIHHYASFVFAPNEIDPEPVNFSQT